MFTKAHKRHANPDDSQKWDCCHICKHLSLVWDIVSTISCTRSVIPAQAGQIVLSFIPTARAMSTTVFCNLTKQNMRIPTFSLYGEDCCTLQACKQSWVYQALTDSASPLSTWSAQDLKFALQAFTARVKSQLGSQAESTRSQSDAIGLQPDAIEDEATHAGPKRLRLDPMVKFDGEESLRLGNVVFSKPRQGCDQTTTLLPISCFQTIWINNVSLQVVGGNEEGPVQLIATVNNINRVFSILEDTFKDWVREGREASNRIKERVASVSCHTKHSCWQIKYIDADGDRHYERFWWTPHRGPHDYLLAQAAALSKARKAWNRLDCSSKPRLRVLVNGWIQLTCLGYEVRI